MKSIIIQVMFLALAALGAALSVLMVFANTFVDNMIDQINVAIANGAPMAEFSDIPFGLLAGGKLVYINQDVATILSVLGVFISYIGIQGLILNSKGRSLKEVLTKSYWSYFSIRS